MEESGQLHALAALPQGKSPWYPLDRKLMDKSLLTISGKLQLQIDIFFCTNKIV